MQNGGQNSISAAYMASVRRFLQPPPGSFFLFGPRGTGKSTWLQQEFPEALRVDLLAPEVLRAYQAKPERLAERIAAAGATTHTVVIDEVQKAPPVARRGACPGGATARSAPRPGGAQLSFWRTRSGLEVDFIMYGPNLFLAIEVKRSHRIDRSDLKALRAFGEDYPEAERLLLSFCPEPLLIDGIRCEPLETWVRQLRP